MDVLVLVGCFIFSAIILNFAAEDRTIVTGVVLDLSGARVWLQIRHNWTGEQGTRREDLWAFRRGIVDVSRAMSVVRIVDRDVEDDKKKEAELFTLRLGHDRARKRTMEDVERS
jgi:hypothetical protein